MKQLYLLSALLSSSTLLAQPTVTMNNMPEIGDVLPIGFCSDIPVAATLDLETGPNYAWDLSGLNEYTESAFHFGTPDTTEWAALWPTAEMVGVVLPDKTYQFYDFSNSAADNLGQAYRISPSETFHQVNSDPERLVELPVTYNVAQSDSWIGVGQASGFDFVNRGLYNLTVDGYGTLDLPTGSYDNVLRFRVNRMDTTYVGGLPGGTIDKDQWIWISADMKFWLCLMESFNDGFGTSHNVWYQKAPMAVGVEEAKLPELQLLHPNPVAINGSLIFDAKYALEGGVLQLWSIEGRLVESYTVNSNRLQLGNVGAGAYLVKLLDANGVPSAMQRLIVQ